MHIWYFQNWILGTDVYLNFKILVPHIRLDCLIGSGVITWSIGWSDPIWTWCVAIFQLLPCLVHLHFEFFNINLSFSFIEFPTRCFWPCWTIFSYVTSLQTTKTCSLTQPSSIFTSKICSNAIFSNNSILLTIVTTIPCILIPIVGSISMVYLSLLIWWPIMLGSALICSISILLTIVVVTFCNDPYQWATKKP